MLKKIILFIGLLASMDSAKSQNKDSIFHFQYKISQAENLVFDSTSNLPLTAQIEMTFDIYTNKKDYLIIPTVDDARIMGKQLPNFIDDDEPVLINSFGNKVFFLKTATYSNYKPLLLSKGDGHNKYFYQAENADTIRFVTNRLYGKEVTPFPYYLLNEYGIESITSKTFQCRLLMVEKIVDDRLQNTLDQTKSFTKGADFFHFPW